VKDETVCSSDRQGGIQSHQTNGERRNQALHGCRSRTCRTRAIDS
jgi:hypothetical protein